MIDILVVMEHPQFGWKISLFAAEILEGGAMRIIGQPDYKAEMANSASETMTELLKAAEETSDRALMNMYSREKRTVNVAKDTVELYIRPRIERLTAKIVENAALCNIPVYLRKSAIDAILLDINRITVLPQTSRAVFNFVKDDEGMRYYIELTNSEKEFRLQQKTCIVLSEKPCIVLLDKAIHRVEMIDVAKLTPFFTKHFISVPPSAEQAYIEKFIIKTIPQYEVRLKGLPVVEITPQRRALLVLEEDFYSRLHLQLFFQYGERRFKPADNPLKLCVVDVDASNRITRYLRSFEWENSVVNTLIDYGLRRKDENRFYVANSSETLGFYALIDWLNVHREQLADFEIVRKTADQYYQGEVHLCASTKISRKIDWFDLEVEVIFDSFSLPFSAFRNHILSGIPQFTLPDKRVFILPDEWFARYTELFAVTAAQGNTLSISKEQTPFLKSALSGLCAEASNASDKALSLLQEAENEPLLPDSLDAVLREYQKDGYFWLRKLRALHRGGCLADDMGLGKTLQTIALLTWEYIDAASLRGTKQSQDKASLRGTKQSQDKASLRSTKQSQDKASLRGTKQSHQYYSLLFEAEEEITFQPLPSLIVVPASLLHNWQNEIRKFSPRLKVHIYSGANRLPASRFHQFNIILTSYGLVRNDADSLSQQRFLYLILDESQYIKNPDSVTYKAVMTLQAEQCLALTGTPIENSLIDLWSLFNFINPGMLGSQSDFRKRFVSSGSINPQATESLLRTIRPFILRRTREEVTPELPPLSQETVLCDMSDEHSEAYNKEKNSIRNLILEKGALSSSRNSLLALRCLTRLRLAANHPVLIDQSYNGASGKYEQIFLYYECLRESGHKALFFSSFVKTLRLLATEFDAKGWQYSMLIGETQLNEREQQIELFNKDAERQAFLISVKAGGTGLNLTAADYVFILDPWWNPAVEMQALSRAWRIGQNKPVTVYRFITSDSIEEKITLLQEAKTRLSEAYVTSSDNPLQSLSPQEIEALWE